MRWRPSTAGDRDLLDSEDFAGAMAELARLRAPLDAFFDKVTVNAPEPELRRNRLRLLHRRAGDDGSRRRFLAARRLNTEAPTMTKWVYSFGAGHNEGRADMRNLLGGKGANLAEMASIGLPVPPGFTITTEVCTAFYANDNAYPAELKEQVRAALARGRAGGRPAASATPHKPLLVSVRSGARVSMPGMMDTVLNLGLNDATVDGLAAAADDARFAWDSYRRFIQMYGSRRARRRSPPVRGDHRAGQAGHRRDRGHRARRAEDWQRVVAGYQGHGATRRPASRSRRTREEQLWGAIGAVFG